MKLTKKKSKKSSDSVSIPSNDSFIQYGKQTIEQCDIDAVIEVLKENKFLTTGPRVDEFEQKVCDLVKCDYAVAVSNGTAALHAAIRAIDLKPDEEVIVPAISFAASSNCVLYEGGVPVFCDVNPETLNIDVNKIERLITKKTRAIVFVDFAGQVPDYHSLKNIANIYNLVLIEDAAHSFGLKINSCQWKRANSDSRDSVSSTSSSCPGRHMNPFVGNFADLTTFSFHPVKNMTTAEGGMIVTNNSEYAKIMKQFRTHGITTEYQNRKLYEYDITTLGYNYRLTDLQCALGISQINRVISWIGKRQEIAKKYNKAFEQYKELFVPLKVEYDSAHHIYIILLKLENLMVDRDVIFAELKERNIGVNVHYKPIYLLTLYQNLNLEKRYQRETPRKYGLYDVGTCPKAEEVYQRIITIPMFPTLTEEQIERVIKNVTEVVCKYRKK